MTNYNDPSKWIILQYRPCTGGKFLCAALMTIDAVAHWCESVENKVETYVAWTHRQWQHNSTHYWLAHEPLHEWNLRFFSRTFPRGEDVTLADYNHLVETSASSYFKKVWNSDKLVLDFIHKSSIPAWWQQSYIIKLDAKQNCPLHKRLLLSKIYPYDADTGMGMFMMDHPFPQNPSANARIYNNPYKFGPFDNEDHWYEFIWQSDPRLNFSIDDPDLYLDDLLVFDKLENFIAATAHNLNSRYNPDDLKLVWDVWINKNKNILQNLDLTT